MISPLYDLIKRVRHDFKLPDIAGERCVYALFETASCSACVDVCHHDAWIMTDDSLGLNVDACDGCGLCAPACPQGAIILHDHAIVIQQQRELKTALCACEYVDLASDYGVIPCINAIGLQDLLQLLQKGVQQLVVSSADCAICERGKTDRLADRITSFNSIVEQSPDVGITLKQLSADAWQKQLDEGTDPSTALSVDRRSFLRNLARANLAHDAEQAGLFLLGQVSYIPPGQLIPNSSTSTQWPYLPILNPDLCNGCDACVKLCPHDAITLDETNHERCYRLNPVNCSGCSICIDVCQQQAVTIHHWQIQQQVTVELAGNICTACGVPFHIPVTQNQRGKTLCRICMDNNHYKNLHQVLTGRG